MVALRWHARLHVWLGYCTAQELSSICTDLCGSRAKQNGYESMNGNSWISSSLNMGLIWLRNIFLFYTPWNMPVIFSSLSFLWMLFLFCKLNFCCCCYRDYCLYVVAGLINNSIQKTELTVAKAELKCDFSVVCYISFKLSRRNVKARQATLRQDSHYDEYKCASTQWTTPWGRCLGRTLLCVCVCVCVG